MVFLAIVGMLTNMKVTEYGSGRDDRSASLYSAFPRANSEP